VAESLAHLEIVGPGRAGLALGARLLAVGAVRRLTFSGRHPHPPAHPLFQGTPPPAGYHAPGSPREDIPDVVLLAVPDSAIGDVAAELARAGLPQGIPVLHLSGALGADVLAPLAERGYPTGALHPLVAFSDEAARVEGAWFAVEGSVAARAVAERLVAALRGRTFALAPEDRVLYHAAAVAASNFVVALLGVAERWMREAGMPAEGAREALAALAGGAVDGVRRLGPVAALTGPVSRGDTVTVQAHLARLSPADRRLYSVLAGSALTLAQQRGLDAEAAAALARLLEPIE
jgi:predicted short-subunit dehydrogenase-like oxidoreductase (DUF2520 family)